MHYINSNILENKNGIICHSVNCFGKWGAGLALECKNKFPKAFEDYRNGLLWPRYKNLGYSRLFNIENDLFLASIFSQFDYGTDFRRTEYGSLYRAMIDLKNQLSYPLFKDLPVYFPYLLACGRGGAEWKIVEEMIDLVFPNSIICKID